MNRWAWLLLALAPACFAQQVRVRVLELLHPQTVTLEAPAGARVLLRTGSEAHALEGVRMAQVVHSEGRLLLHLGFRPLPSSRIEVEGPLIVSAEEIRRRFPGRLTLTAAGEEIKLVVELPLEEAVAAIVAREANPAALPEALRAQAIASRSFVLAAKGRHAGYELCDTTHCQYFTEASEESLTAAESTRSLVLRHGGALIEALSTRRCGGTTRTLAQVGLRPDRYPYFPVACEPCRRKPSPWERTLTASLVAPLLKRPGNENARLAVARKLGWSSVPSNDYAIRVEGEKLILQGRGQGHGVGLCQFGAAELAHKGWSAIEILEHYFPNATIGSR